MSNVGFSGPKKKAERNMHSPRRVDFTHDVLKKTPFDDSQPAPNSFSWQLWMDNQDIAQLALDSKYVQGIANGNLDPNSYGCYSIQDCAYCYNAKNDYLTIESIAHEKNKPEIASFAKARYDGYVTYIAQILKSWNLSNVDGIVLGKAAGDYVELEHMIANNAFSSLLGIVAMIPCDQLWSWLGDELVSYNTPKNIYDFWINDNQGWTGAYRLDNFVNQEIKQYPSDSQERELASMIYRACMICELNFFSSACDQQLMKMPDLSNL